MKNLLFVGDAGCPSGFARATHGILDTLRFTYNVTVLGINYRGDPYDYPYPLYAAEPGGDSIGIGRLIWMCDLIKKNSGHGPDVIVLQNDPWNIPQYLYQLRQKRADGKFRFTEYAAIPVVAAVAVDGKNIDGASLNGLDLAIFWTQFGLDEARSGGYTGPAAVIPLGVDLETFRPVNRAEARVRRLPAELPGGVARDKAFIVGNVNRNQPRKRLDLTIKYFAEWVHGCKPVEERTLETLVVKDAYLYLHVAPTGDTGTDVRQLARYYCIHERLALMEPEIFYGMSEDDMRDTYNCFNVDVTTSQGEGMGLTTLEAMACRIPVIASDWAAIGDWARDAVWLIPCTSTHIGPPYVNVIGGVADQHKFVLALNSFYQYPEIQEQNGLAALERVQEPRFRWTNIGEAWADALDLVLAPVENEEGALVESAIQ